MFLYTFHRKIRGDLRERSEFAAHSRGAPRKASWFAGVEWGTLACSSTHFTGRFAAICGYLGDSISASPAHLFRESSSRSARSEITHSSAMSQIASILPSSIKV